MRNVAMSAAEEVLRKHHAEICKVLSVDSDTLKRFAGELFAKKMIDMPNKTEVIRIGSFDGANKLQDILMLKIEATPQLFDTIIEIMTKIESLKDIAEKMKEKVGKLQMVLISQSVHCTDALSTAKHLRSQFEKFLGAINDSLANVNIDNLRIAAFHNPIILKNDDSNRYWTDLENCKSAEDLFLCLKKGNLICYFNYNIVEVFLKVPLRNNTALDSFLKDYKGEFIKLLHYNFPSIVQLFHNFEVAPAAGIGLPDFTLHIGTKCRHSNIYSLFKEVFEWRFPWAQHLLILDVTTPQNCILIKYAVLPFFVSTVFQDLIDPKVISELKHQDITIELSPLLQGVNCWLKFLENNLLSPSKWQPLFKQEEITCEEELELCQGEEQVYTALSAQASKMEKRKLKKLLKIVDVQEDMIKIIEASDLDPVIWVEKFKREGVTSPTDMKVRGKELYDSLSKHAKSSIEKETLRNFLGLERIIESEKDYPVKQISYKAFLTTLNCLQYYPQKLTLQESLVVNGDKYSCNSTTDPQMLLLSTLEKIKKSNRNFRKIMLYGKKMNLMMM